MAAIFFFEEIWSLVPKYLKLDRRRAAIGHACKTVGAKHKKPLERAKVTKHKADSTASKSLAVTPSVNLANRILIQWSLWPLRRDPSVLIGIKNTLLAELPDLHDMPDSSNEGIVAFYDYDQPMEQEDLEKLISESKVCALFSEEYILRCPNEYL